MLEKITKKTPAAADQQVYLAALQSGDDALLEISAFMLKYFPLYDATVEISAAAGGADEALVTFSVVDANGVAIAGVHHLDILLSDAATGAGLTATTASGNVEAATDAGLVIDTYTAKKALRVQTLADGTFILSITDTSATEFYPVAINPYTGNAVVGTQLAAEDYGSA